MGEVIKKNAAVDDIIADAQTAHDRAVLKKGVWESLAKEKLGACVVILAKVNTDIAAVQAILAPLQMAVDEVDDRADKFLGAKSDEIWNKLDRPGNDPAFSLLFPGGISAYTEGSDDEQPDRMDLLADLLEAGIHPRLDAAYAKGIAGEIREISTEYRGKVNAIVPPRSKLRLLVKVKTAVARSAQIQLAGLKRSWLSAGFTEAQIHEVIPDRPSSKPGSKPA